MERRKNITFIKILVLITFLLMITVNALANIIPINRITTGEVSDYYANLFAPAGITFAIWGLIYLLLAGYTIYQLGFLQKDSSKAKEGLFKKIGLYFSISSIANVIWILCWHYRVIPSTMILMIVLLVCLIIIVLEIKKVELSFKDKLFIKLPFSIYFGWITIATIANVTTLLVSIGWDGFGISEEIWTIIIILVGLLIGAITILVNKDIPYGLVIIWAYIGILIKHKSLNGFNGEYPAIIITVIISIILLIVTELYVLLHYKTREN
ncbi:lantibiotic ABC transporter permease [Clostridium grantii]|uniref:TspO and MBR related proteins n=1 Tax=Clostridium grantii DSM 8605 TaxID=1121316 RepID=A0A1M5VL43_9CLOT|nr:lantibiotic ABC transporter permease [Clostridium grantii]SHH75972.1 hypothetical protein SAMN02745207_02330 [Clostridium grantii DSM 8605]